MQSIQQTISDWFSKPNNLEAEHDSRLPSQGRDDMPKYASRRPPAYPAREHAAPMEQAVGTTSEHADRTAHEQPMETGTVPEEASRFRHSDRIRSKEEHKTHHREGKEEAYRELRREHNICRGELDRYRADLAVAEAKLAEKDHSLQNAHAELRRRDELLETTTQELNAANSLLSTAVATSEDEVVQEVRDINSRVINVSDSISSQNKYRMAGEQPTSHPTFERVKRILGVSMASLLALKDHSEDETAVQLAIQQVLLLGIDSMSRVWREEGQSVDDICAKIHDLLRHDQVQAVSGRWRCLTHETLRLSRTSEETAGLIHRWTVFTCNRIAAVLQLAKTQEPLDLRRAEGEVRPLMVLGLELSQLFFERMVACDFELVLEESGTHYSGASMEAGHGARDGAVVCTVGAGLRKRVNIARRGERFEEKCILLLKPQVVVESQI